MALCRACAATRKSSAFTTAECPLPPDHRHDSQHRAEKTLLTARRTAARNVHRASTKPDLQLKCPHLPRQRSSITDLKLANQSQASVVGARRRSDPCSKMIDDARTTVSLRNGLQAVGTQFVRSAALYPSRLALKTESVILLMFRLPKLN